MSGHSKWANIKRKKEANDKIKSNVFGKMSRLITLAVIQGGGIPEPENNVRLRLAIEKAQSVNMPKENIKRAIERAVGPNKTDMKEMIYEAFGPYGTYLVILAATDNSNRTMTEVKVILDKNKVKLGSQNSVLYQFIKCGLVVFDKKTVNQDDILELVDKLQSFDLEEDDDFYNVYIPYENLGRVKEILGDKKYSNAEVYFKPQNKINIEDDNKLQEISQLIDSLEALDDVQKVFTNL